MSQYLAIKDKDGVYGYFPVRREISQYVKQLETYIKHPHMSKLREVYKDRFGKEDPNLLQVIKDDLKCFRRICLQCDEKVRSPCKCAWQLRIDTLTLVIKNAETLPDIPVELETEIDID